MRSEKGITLITLVLTMVIMIILITTISINLNLYKAEVARNSFEEDINALKEEIEQYYAIYKTLPIINKYGYTDMFNSVKNINDNENYYVIDIRKLDVELNLGSEFYKILAKDRDEEVLDFLDVYIMNESSHTVYYPKGVNYNGVILYTVIEPYSGVQGELQDSTAPTVTITLAKSSKLFGVIANITIADEFSGVDLSKCKYIFTKSAEALGTNISTYNQGKSIFNLTTSIEQALGPSDNWYLHVLATDKAGNKVEAISTNSVKVDSTAEFPYTGDVQTADMLPGRYQMECWGAQGGDAKTDQSSTTYIGGKGGYTSGTLILNKNKELYVYVGGTGTDSVWNRNDGAIAGGYNGGGPTTGQYTENKRCWGTGGGATDIRLTGGTWNTFNSLKSRIIVSAGGGGAFCQNPGDNGGSAGGLEGYEGLSAGYSDVNTRAVQYYYGKSYGASQTQPGYILLPANSKFNSTSVDIYEYSKFGYSIALNVANGGLNSAGGGGGYYGGVNSGHVNSASGGSSFISGHTGCDAITETSTEDNIVHTGQSKHYSGYVFTNTKMIDGAGYNCTMVNGEEVKVQEQMPNPAGGKYALGEGHTGDGYARITNLN